ncbi:MAG: GNAT family N-acetyltransferase [Deltaproteobacteria bacterium]|nr:GNAT family N-acetyltransferase [Deltaproteobacteria bacterium]
MSPVILVQADELDYSAFVDLQIKAYAHLLSSAGTSSEYMTEEFYRWKYNPPAGQAWIAIVKSNKGYIAANAMIPQKIRWCEKTILGWQSCDTATIPDARGKGYFQRCLDALNEIIGPSDIFFGFPNKNSIRGFIKLGWKEISSVTTYVNPFVRFQPYYFSEVFEIERFDIKFDILFEKLTRLGWITLEHGVDYLNWRYLDHPIYDYSCFICQKNKEYSGFAVLREAEVFNQSVGLVMDLWCLDSSSARKLLQYAAWWARQRKLRLAVHMDSLVDFSTNFVSGFIPIWSKILPKRQILMGQGTYISECREFSNNQWRVQLGDWDAF